MKKPGIKVFAPATVANVACGFDILGFAIDKPGDEIIATLNPNRKGLQITKITGDKGKLPYEVEKNTAGVAAQRLLEFLGTDQGIDLEVHKRMPFGSGLGSSAASAAGAVWAVNKVLKANVEKKDLMPFAVAGEAIADGSVHADNVAASLLGGMTMCRDNETLDVHRLHIPSGLYASVVYPYIKILTSEAREVLKPDVSLANATKQCGNLAGLIVGLQNGDFDLIGRSLQDVLVEPQRKVLIPGFDEIKEAALSAGALGCSISGAGPSIFALSANSLIAEKAGQAMKEVFDRLKIQNDLYVSEINTEGVTLC